MKTEQKETLAIIYSEWTENEKMYRNLSFNDF